MANKKQISLDSLFPGRRKKEVRESPAGKPHPIKYPLDAERSSKTVKFVIYANDDFAEVEDVKADRDVLKDLILEVLQYSKSLKKGKAFIKKGWEKNAIKALGEIYNRPLDEKKVKEIKGYFNIGTYADGHPGELLIYAGKQGHETHGWLDSWGRAVTMLLQYGVDPQKIYNEFRGMEFQPKGVTNMRQSMFCKSIVDMIMKYMEGDSLPTQVDLNKGDSDYFATVETVTEKKD